MVVKLYVEAGRKGVGPQGAQSRSESFTLRRVQPMYHNAIRNNPDPSDNQGSEYTASCPFCHRPLTDQIYVGPTGELIGCEDCAVERGLIGEPISLEEWFEPEGLQDVLRQFGLASPQIRKPSPSPTQQPRAHYWEVTSEGTRYFLKRFYSWYPNSAVVHMHSV